MHFKAGIISLLAAGSAMAHMNLKDPAPLTYKDNPYTEEKNIDYSITSPITGAQYPCKNNLGLLGTPDGTAVKTYSPGQQSTISLAGSAIHNGGSCQISLSYDKGKTFTVIKSFIGNCPKEGGGTYDFTVPEDAPEGDDVIFAWTWVNKTGNREFYMSCAVVNIKSGGGAKRAVEKRGVSFANRPQVFQANLGGKYCTKEGVDTVYPEPGPDVENNASSPGPAILCDSGEPAPTGDAGSGSGSGSGGGVFLTTGGNASPTTFSTVTSTSAPATSATTSSAASSSSAPASSAPAATSTTVSAQQPAPTGGASGLQTGACTPEGSWNCVDGASFQRCASGVWSLAMPLAAGTTCTPGVSDILSMSRRRDHIRRRHW